MTMRNPEGEKAFIIHYGQELLELGTGFGHGLVFHDAVGAFVLLSQHQSPPPR